MGPGNGIWEWEHAGQVSADRNTGELTQLSNVGMGSGNGSMQDKCQQIGIQGSLYSCLTWEWELGMGPCRTRVLTSNSGGILSFEGLIRICRLCLILLSVHFLSNLPVRTLFLIKADCHCLHPPTLTSSSLHTRASAEKRAQGFLPGG